MEIQMSPSGLIALIHPACHSFSPYSMHRYVLTLSNQTRAGHGAELHRCGILPGTMAIRRGLAKFVPHLAGLAPHGSMECSAQDGTHQLG